MKETVKNTLKPRAAIVEEKKQETENIFTLKFTIMDEESFSCLPGQYNMLGLPGFGEAAISFSSVAINKKSFIHTIMIVGNVTKAICRLNVGDTVQFRGPYGNGWPLKKAEGKDVIIIAGGIGMAPIRPIIHHVLNNRKKYKKIFLLYGSKQEEIILYKDELEAWSKSGEVKVLLSVDREPETCFLNLCHGLVTTRLNDIDVPLSNAVTFTCGTEPMMHFVCKGLKDKGHKTSNMFVSLERNMKCAVGHCGHCQIGPKFVCKDGPIFVYDEIKKYADNVL